MKCYRRLSGSSPRRQFHTFIVKTRVSGSKGSGCRRKSDSPRVTAAEGGSALATAGCPARKLRRVKHAGPPTSRLARHGDVWKLANDRVAAFYYLIRNTKEINNRSGGVGLLKSRDRGGGARSTHQNHIFHLSSWLRKHLGWKLDENIPN